MRGTLPRSSVEQDSDQIVETVRQTLKLEGEALTDFADRLPEDIEEVVRLLVETIGRVVVTGMGKSGHVARKIAATLSSTGTPSFYLHPGEASHSDLGYVADEVATRTPITTEMTTTAAEAVGLMNRHKIHSLFVVDTDRRPIGLLRLHDCLRAGVL